MIASFVLSLFGDTIRTLSHTGASIQLVVSADDDKEFALSYTQFITDCVWTCCIALLNDP